MNLPPIARSNDALVGVINQALACLADSGTNGAARYMGSHKVPQDVITRVLRYPAYRRPQVIQASARGTTEQN